MDSSSAAALRRLLDKDQIIDLVHRYSYCVDQRLYDEVVELFTEDCVVDYGPGFAPPVRSRAGLRQMFGHPEARFCCHQPPQLERLGDVRGCRSCFGTHVRVRLAPAG